MVPIRISPFFSVFSEKSRNDNVYIKGVLQCCECSDFSVLFYGIVKKQVICRHYLLPKKDRVALRIRCNICGRIINVFDSETDGFYHFQGVREQNDPNERFYCERCHKETFTIRVKYEYAGLQEMKNLGKNEPENGFSWIQISLQCNNCLKKYTKLLDWDAS